MTTTKLPFTTEEWKIPGYTGYVQGIQETYKQTPIMAQLETKVPDQEFSFIHTRTQVAYKSTHTEQARDPCNDPESLKKKQPEVLWPSLLTEARQESVKPRQSNISFGDGRIDPFKTTASLADIFRSAYNRVGDKRLQKMISTMRERMEAKLFNSNDNAFKIRKLFLKFDKEGTGMVHYEDLRQMCESFGMQLDDDSLLALFYVYDPEGTGYMAYMDLVKHLMSPDTFCYYLGFVDNSQDAANTSLTNQVLRAAAKKFQKTSGELEGVLAAFDKPGSGYLDKSDVVAGCASLGVVLTDNEM